ncbi:glycine-rich domain-containing protein 2 isoform X3 [Solanum pennellii]|uniref:Glycine-rich domain-containing protein 2 isoform X3 n=1 Tax=Solanum pennellii TaxID=28526 RepID=A0ABM1VBT6_SOLPN|nr:glycine-rich domain-containing protein 2 isoform X3 [Solanum pennellii]
MSTSDVASMRSLSEISEEETVRLSIDLVAAARRNLGFLRLVTESQWLQEKPTILESIRRYDQLWMPLISDLSNGSNPPMILPPFDIEWVWYCHTLNPVSYRQYCESRFSKLIGKAAIFNEENGEYALNRCKEIWVHRYPTVPFENESDDSNLQKLVSTVHEELLKEVSKQRNYLCTKFSEPYYSEIVYLIAARQRYKGFLYMMHKLADSCSVLVPTSDILLMWITHQSYPTAYTLDTKGLEEEMRKVVGGWENVKEADVENTKKLWERIFDQPYEKAGGLAIGKAVDLKPPIYWEVTDTDVNAKYSSMLPRFLLEVCLTVKLKPKMKPLSCDASKEFLRFQMVRCHRELKIDRPFSKFTSQRWQKALHLYCEFGTKGMVLEVRQRGGGCIKGSSLRESVTFLWNDLLRAPSLNFAKEIDQKVRVATSITPPVQASYLLKCVPDRVSDDSGAMISDVILRMNQYHPQEGRWLSRTVLDHAGRECFVIRFRVGGGFWRRGAETPSAVKWEDRIIEIREGRWSYVAGSIGRAPEKVVGIAKPKDPPEGWHALWNLSTGHELLVQWESSRSTSGLNFSVINQQSTDSVVKLLEGRQMQYEVKKSGLGEEIEHVPNEKLKQVEDKEEDGFITVVRFSEDNPVGKATALLNWKLMVVEFSPEEDAVFILLLCMSIIRSISEMKKEDVGSLLIRRRIKEAKLGDRDWGSVVVHASSYSPSISSPHLQPWYWNVQAVMGSQGVDNIPRLQAPVLTYTPAEGGDKLYKHGIIN